MSLLTKVVDCIAETTRYPKELLTPNADMETDLGIDSVKRAEITLALGEAFGLELMDEERDPNVRTIGDVTQWIERLAAQNSGATSSPAPASPTVNNPAQPSNYMTHPAESSPPAPMGFMQGTSANNQRLDAGLNGSPVSPTNGYSSSENGIPTRDDSDSYNSGAKPLQGRVALVTGSGRSVGRTIARMLASRGATVVVNSFHSRERGEQTVKEIIESGGNAIHAWGSVANPEHVNSIFSLIQQQFGYLDMLVCNASDGRIGSFSDITPDDWDRAFRTNVSGHYQCAMRAAPLMQTRGGGSIVTMSALGAHTFVNGLGSQGVAKAAVETLTKYLAGELGKYGVRVNCVAGGPVYGDLLNKFPQAESRLSQWEAMTPLGQLTSPLDLARTIAYLVSDDASGINGAVWQVDQGFSAITEGRSNQPMQRESRQQQIVS